MLLFVSSGLLYINHRSTYKYAYYLSSVLENKYTKMIWNVDFGTTTLQHALANYNLDLLGPIGLKTGNML